MQMLRMHFGAAIVMYSGPCNLLHDLFRIGGSGFGIDRLGIFVGHHDVGLTRPGSFAQMFCAKNWSSLLPPPMGPINISTRTFRPRLCYRVLLISATTVYTWRPMPIFGLEVQHDRFFTPAPGRCLWSN